MSDDDNREGKKKKRSERKKSKRNPRRRAYYDPNDPYAQLFPTNVPVMTHEEIIKAIDEGPPPGHYSESPLPEDKEFFDMAAMDRLDSRNKLKIPGYKFPWQDVPPDDEVERFKSDLTRLMALQKARKAELEQQSTSQQGYTSDNNTN